MILFETLRLRGDADLLALVRGGGLVCSLGYWCLPDRFNWGMLHPVPDDLQDRLDSLIQEQPND